MERRLRHSVLALIVSGLLLVNVSGTTLARGSGVPLRQQAGPSFVFPSDGTVLPYNSTLTFQVQPVSGANGYLWSFVQNGGIAWQNLDSDGSLSSNTYTMKPGGRAHNSVRPGPLQVRVRAQLGGNHWTAASVITVQLQGKGTPTNPKSGPPAPGTVLYQADTSGGLNKWAGSSEWKHVNGMLVNDGSSSTSAILAPYRPQGSNYAIEAQIQMIRGGVFGVVARVTSGRGYLAGFYSDGGTRAAILAGTITDLGSDDALTGQAYSLDNNYHTYRMEVQGNTVRMSVDGSPLLSTIDNKYLTNGQIGLFSFSTQVNVRSFKVIAL